MSKLDAVRALREARFKQEEEQRKARAGAGTGAKAAPRRAAPTTTRTSAPTSGPAAESGPESAADDEQRCGHRNISGRTCTRERGHAAKTHRYS